MWVETFLVALLLQAPATPAPETPSVILMVSVGSYHHPKLHFNRVNPGLGVEYHVRLWRVGVGYYFNSVYQHTAYAHIGPEKKWGVCSFGFGVGAMTGYPRPVMPMAALVFRIGKLDRLHLKAQLLPVRRPIFGFQVGIGRNAFK